MKKILSMMVCLVAIMACVSLSSCSKDDDDQQEETTTNSLVGTWSKIDSGTITYFIFKEKGTAYVYVYNKAFKLNQAGKGTWTVSNNKLKVVVGTKTLSVSYSIDGEKMSWTYDVDGETEDFVKTPQPLTDSELDELING